MKVDRADSARAIFAAVVLALVIFVLLVLYAPDSIPFSPNNYGWNGLQGVASTYRVNFTTSLSAVPTNSVLVVSQPSVNYSASDAAAVRSFLVGGGTVLVADKSGVGNSLLSRLGSGITIQGEYRLSDSTYNWKSQSVPTALVLPSAQTQFPFLANVAGIALSQPSPLAVSGGAAGLAVTSQFSVSALSHSPGNAARGPFVVMAAQKFGSGTLIVIGDSQFLLNSGWTIANNKALIGNIFANTSVYMDASHWGVSSTAQVKAAFNQYLPVISSSPMKYIATLFVVGIALALVPSRKRSESMA